MTSDAVAQLFDLTGRVALVTGGSRGLGRAIAGGLAAAGAAVVLASRKLDVCEAAAAEIEAAGGRALPLAVHMDDVAEVEALVERTVDHFGRLDVVVANAANALAQPVGGITEAGFDKSFGVNVKGPLFLAQAAVPHLAAGGHGSIINTISVGGFRGAPGMALYTAGKAALWHLTRTMAVELNGQGIRVNAIAPGPFDTDMVPADGPFRQAITDSSLMRRLADPSEIVPAALYLASDASSFVTGTALVVDGGSMA